MEGFLGILLDLGLHPVLLEELVEAPGPSLDHVPQGLLYLLNKLLAVPLKGPDPPP